MKTFLTGATGFIGTHLARRLAAAEHELVCLVRKTSNVRTLEELGATLIRGDVTDRDSVLQGMQGCEGLIHLANIYTFWEPDRQVYRDVNIEGTRNVLECALEIGVRKVVHVSTAVVYGKPADCPFTEESPVGPERFSEYARTKYEGDRIAWDLHDRKGLPLVMIYPGAVLGPGDDKPTGQFIDELIHRRAGSLAFADSASTYVHVRDVTEAILRVLVKEDNVGARYLLGKHTLSNREYCALIGEVSGTPVPRFVPDSIAMGSVRLLVWLAGLTGRPPPFGWSLDRIRTDREGFAFDGSKAERELGITYTPIRKALEEEIAWHRQVHEKEGHERT